MLSTLHRATNCIREKPDNNKDPNHKNHTDHIFSRAEKKLNKINFTYLILYFRNRNIVYFCIFMLSQLLWSRLHALFFIIPFLQMLINSMHLHNITKITYIWITYSKLEMSLPLRGTIIALVSCLCHLFVFCFVSDKERYVQNIWCSKK